jgi:hypothetical protein
MSSNMAVVFNATTGQQVMHVVPTSALELEDPAFNPPGCSQLLIPIPQYQLMNDIQLRAFVAPLINQLVQGKLQTIMGASIQGPEQQTWNGPRNKPLVLGNFRVEK